MSKTRKRLLTAAAVVAVTVGASAGAAVAGEVTGNGKVLPVNGNSICAFSGLEDHPVDPGTTQNWGQIPKAERDFLVSIGVSPGTLCNAHLNPQR